MALVTNSTIKVIAEYPVLFGKQTLEFLHLFLTRFRYYKHTTTVEVNRNTTLRPLLEGKLPSELQGHIAVTEYTIQVTKRGKAAPFAKLFRPTKSVQSYSAQIIEEKTEEVAPVPDPTAVRCNELKRILTEILNEQDFPFTYKFKGHHKYVPDGAAELDIIIYNPHPQKGDRKVVRVSVMQSDDVLEFNPGYRMKITPDLKVSLCDPKCFGKIVKHLGRVARQAFKARKDKS
jgi:hypothetical protein